MRQYTYILCIGSNTEAEKNLAFARSRLSLLGDADYAPAEWTQAVGCDVNLNPFLNQVARMVCRLSEEELKLQLKNIEQAAGRTPDEKAKEIIRLDIDILAINHKVLKQEDWEREYVERGIEKIRANQPQASSLDALNIMQPERITFANGIPVCVFNAGEHEVVRIDVVINGGRWHQSKPLQAIFTNRMLREGTRSYSGIQIAEKLDYYGAWLELSSSAEYAFITLYSLNKYLAQTLEVLESIVKEPIFPEQELKVVLNANVQQFLVNNSKVDFHAHRGLVKHLYGENHPCGRIVQESDYGAIDRDLLESFYRRYYNSTNCTIYVAGKVSDENLKRIEKLFGEEPFGNTLCQAERQNFVPSPSAEKRIFIERPDAKQSAVRIGTLTIDNKHSDSFKLRVLVTLFGGYFGSRLMSNIREEKGYTYGIAAGIIDYPEQNVLHINTETTNEYVEPLIKEVYREIDKLQNELVSTDELTVVKNYMLGEMCRTYESVFSLSDAWIYLHTLGAPDSYFSDFVEAVKSVSSQELRELACRYLCKEKLKEVVSGKKIR